jgi:hypothetical protein
LPNNPQQPLQQVGSPLQQAGMQAVTHTVSSQQQRRQQGSQAVSFTLTVGSQGAQQSPLRIFAAEAGAGVNDTTATANNIRAIVNRIQLRMFISPGGKISTLKFLFIWGASSAHKMTKSDRSAKGVTSDP